MIEKVALAPTGYRLEREDTLLAESRRLVAEAATGTENVTWQFVFKHRSPCLLINQYLLRGLTLREACQRLIEDPAAALSCMETIKHNARSRKITEKEYVDQLLRESSMWEEETSLNGGEDDWKLLTKMRTRLRQCTQAGVRVHLSIFFANRDNRDFVLRLLRGEVEIFGERINVKSLRELSEVLLNDRESLAFNNFLKDISGNAPRRTIDNLRRHLESY